MNPLGKMLRPHPGKATLVQVGNQKSPVSESQLRFWLPLSHGRKDTRVPRAGYSPTAVQWPILSLLKGYPRWLPLKIVDGIEAP